MRSDSSQKVLSSKDQDTAASIEKIGKKQVKLDDEGSGKTKKAKTQSDSFERLIRENLVPDKNGEVNEEQLFVAAAAAKISQSSGANARERFLSEVSANFSQSHSYEEAGKAALKKIQDLGIISSRSLGKIYSQAFAAAQLDSNTEALWDGTGGRRDKTIAVGDKTEAAATAAERLQEFLLNPDSVTSRDVDEIPLGRVDHQKGRTIDGPGNFSFNPARASDGFAEITVPKEVSQKVTAVLLRDFSGNIIDVASETDADENGARKFAFSASGISFPSNIIVEVQLTKGPALRYLIPRPSKNYD